ncbi:uncharacterized protein LOC124490994 [Dermatophagoides farinae]|nr:uncharacterized protein LOC124490994 [Dermatophagoides farinae]KAH9527740.1 hypothetical protein DERF_001746 [Dermatophagoides farinae]KAH9527741.1 hypothetical protein DERF_001746 [Dermatophagoides farinae]
MSDIVERTREFIPNDIIEPSLAEREKLLDSRIEELRQKRESFDPNTQFVGIRRLGSSYTVAEPFAYFDGPSEQQLRFDHVTFIGLSAFIFAGAAVFVGQMKNLPHVVSLFRGTLAAIPGGYFGHKFYDFRRQLGRKKNNTYFAYALLHEKDFPKIERKKFNDITRDFTAHRSLNISVLGLRW